jgi:hypothetical protein
MPAGEVDMVETAPPAIRARRSGSLYVEIAKIGMHTARD